MCVITDTFILYKKENTILVKLRDDNLKREQLEAYIRECVEKSNGEGVDLAAMGQKLHKKYPDFKVKEYGYSTLQKFVSHISGLELITESETVKRLVEKKESDAEPMIAQSQKTTVKKRKKLKS